MKKILSLLILSLFLLTGCGSKGSPVPQKDLLAVIHERGKIIAGTKFDSKPFGYLDKNEQLKGFDVDLMREITKRILGDVNDIEFKEVNASNRILALSSESVDLVIATMTINEQRATVVDFSNPYFMTGQVVMIPQNSNIKSVRDLNDKNVAVVLGTTAEKNIRFLAPQSMIKGYRSYNEAFSALRSGRADALTSDDSILYGIIMDNPQYKILPDRYTKEYYGIAFRKDEASDSLQNAVNKALEDIKNDGTLMKLVKKWKLNEKI